MVIEVRDINTLYLYAELMPEYLIVTNLIKEQLSRKGEFQTTINALKEYLSNNQ